MPAGCRRLLYSDLAVLVGLVTSYMPFMIKGHDVGLLLRHLRQRLLQDAAPERVVVHPGGAEEALEGAPSGVAAADPSATSTSAGPLSTTGPPTR